MGGGGEAWFHLPDEACRVHSDPGGPQRRGRQQYPKTKEGPMKGFAPPVAFGGVQVPSEPMPIHPYHHGDGRHQRKEPGREAGVCAAKI